MEDEPAPMLAPESRWKSMSPVAGSLSCVAASRPSGTRAYWRWILDHQRLQKPNPLQQGPRETPAARARSIHTPLGSSRLSPFSFFSAKTKPTDPFHVCSPPPPTPLWSPIPHPSVRPSVLGHAAPPERFILRHSTHRSCTPRASLRRGACGSFSMKTGYSCSLVTRKKKKIL